MFLINILFFPPIRLVFD